MKIFLTSFFIFSIALILPIVILANDRESALLTITPRGKVVVSSKVLGADSADENAKVDSENENEVETEDQVADEVEEVEIEMEEGQINLKTKTATGSSQMKSADDKLLVKVEAAEKKNDVNIKKKGSKLEIEQNGINVETEFGLKVDTDTNAITVVTSNGDHRLKILPAEMVENLIKDNKIERSLAIEIIGDPEDKGRVVYRLEAEKDAKLFSLIQTKFNVTVFVDIGTGTVTKQETPFVLRFFGFLFSK